VFAENARCKNKFLEIDTVEFADVLAVASKVIAAKMHGKFFVPADLACKFLRKCIITIYPFFVMLCIALQLPVIFYCM
jgi:hypothetical protein